MGQPIDLWSPPKFLLPPEKAFGVMFEALDSLKANDVYICTGSLRPYANWGELMSTRAEILGAVGAVVSGYSRDTPGILKMNFPTFSSGCYGQDQGVRGRVIDYNCPIEFSNTVCVNPGDIVLAISMESSLFLKKLKKKSLNKPLKKSVEKIE